VLFVSCFLLSLLTFLSLCTVLLTIVFLITCFLWSSSTFISDDRSENSAQRGKKVRGKSKKQEAKSTL